MAGKSDFNKQKSVCSDSDDEKNYSDEDLTLELLSMKQLNLGPRKKLLILHIGGLLCHRVCYKDRYQAPIHRQHDVAYGSYKVYKRPFCEDFMKFCLERFEVGIWSSARQRNLNSALDCITRGLRGKLLFVWDQDHCTNTGFDTLEKKNKPIFLKELKRAWERNWHTGRYSELNTLLIDDKPYKALLNPPYTGIFPTEYKAKNVGDDALGLIGELRLYLAGVADADDVPTYVKANPFGQPAITARHADWDYYSKIINKFSS